MTGFSASRQTWLEPDEKAARLAIIRERFLDGASLRAIGTLVGLSYERTREIIATQPDADELRAARALRIAERAEGRIEDLKAMLKAGASDEEIAAQLGVAQATIGRWRRKLNIYRDPIFWTEELIVERMQRWAARHGRPPSANDWNPANQPVEHQAWARALHTPEFPYTYTVQSRFGSWAAAIEAAGLSSNPSGAPGHRQ